MLGKSHFTQAILDTMFTMFPQPSRHFFVALTPLKRWGIKMKRVIEFKINYKLVESDCTHGYWVEFPVHCSLPATKERDSTSVLFHLTRLRPLRNTSKGIKFWRNVVILKSVLLTNNSWYYVKTWCSNRKYNKDLSHPGA